MGAVDRNELITIGRFAEISGLSVHTLRHYDDVGLLTPAAVDGTSGYRRYRRDQVGLARLIQALRRVDLPIDDVRRLLADPAGPDTTDILTRHRDRLIAQHAEMTTQIDDVEDFIKRGIAMPATTKARPSQMKIAVDDTDEAVTFYQRAFGLRYDVIRRTQDATYSAFVFSEYPADDFFMLVLQPRDAADAERAGDSTIGFLVDDLDGAHAAAIAAGGSELVAPRDAEGMPRNSAVKDPSGNTVWLYENYAPS